MKKILALAAALLFFSAPAFAASPQVVASIAALRAGNFASYPTISLKAYTASGTIGGGVLNLDAADTTTADNGCTVIVDVASHRFKRQYTGPVDVTWCGAKGDGATDDGAAFNRAIAAAGSRGGIYAPCPASVYYIATAVAFTSGVNYDACEGARLDPHVAGVNVSISNGSTGNAVYRNLSITRPSGTNSAANFVALDLVNNLGGGLNFENLEIYPSQMNSGAICLRAASTFEVHFTGVTKIRDCATLISGISDAGFLGVNVMTFDQVLWVIDSGFPVSTAMVKICTGNSWTVLGGEIINAGTATVGFDIGNCTLGASDFGSSGHNFSYLQAEGNFTNLWQAGRGTYAGTAQYPRSLTITAPYITAAGITGNVVDFRYVQGATISLAFPPTVLGGQYIVSAANTTNGITIFDALFNSTYYSLLGTNTNIVGGNQVTTTAVTGSTSVTVGACSILKGAGSPEAAVTGSPCYLYLNTSGGAGTTLYVKESGVSTNTGWVGK